MRRVGDPRLIQRKDIFFVREQAADFALEGPAYLASSAFLILAQRAFCAAAILARPAALNERRLLGLAPKCGGLKLVALLLTAVAAGRPSLPLTWVGMDESAKSAFACWSREISASIARTMLFVFMNPPHENNA